MALNFEELDESLVIANETQNYQSQERAERKAEMLLNKTGETHVVVPVKTHPAARTDAPDYTFRVQSFSEWLHDCQQVKAPVRFVYVAHM